MKLPFSDLRMLVLLRRIACALESLSESNRVLASVARERKQAREARAARRPRTTQFDTLDIAEVEKRWNREREEAAVLRDGEELDNEA